MAALRRPFPERMLVADLDPLSQAEQWTAGTSSPGSSGPRSDRWPTPAPGASSWWMGVLRTGDLFGERILLLDVQVLDGIFFLHAGPDALAAVLGRSPLDPPALHLTAREPSLFETLRRIALRPDGTLTSFQWSTLKALGLPARPVARRDGPSVRGLAECAPEEVPRVLAGLLGLQHADDPWTEPIGTYRILAEAWEAWARAQQTGRVRVSPWRRTQFDLAGQLRAMPTPAVPEDAIVRVAKVTSRSALEAELHDASLAGSTGPTTQALESWWRHGYARALARQHDAGWFQLDPHWPPGTAEPPGDVVHLEHRAVEILGNQPAAVFATTRYRARAAIEEWEQHPSQRAADALGYAVRESTTRSDLTAERRGIRRRLALTLVPIVIGVTALIWQSATVSLVAGAGATAAELTIVLVVELAGLRRTQGSRIRAYLNVPDLAR